MTCKNCDKPLTTQEQACYRAVCEDCWVLIFLNVNCPEYRRDPIAERMRFADDFARHFAESK